MNKKPLPQGMPEGSNLNKIEWLARQLSGGGAVDVFETTPEKFIPKGKVKDVHYLNFDSKKRPLLLSDLVGDLVNQLPNGEKPKPKPQPMPPTMPPPDFYIEKKVRLIIGYQSLFSIELKNFEKFNDLMKLQGLRLNIDIGHFGKLDDYSMSGYNDTMTPPYVGTNGGTRLGHVDATVCALDLSEHNRLMVRAKDVCSIEFDADKMDKYLTRPVCINADWRLTGWSFEEFMENIRWVENGANFKKQSGYNESGDTDSGFKVTVLSREMIDKKIPISMPF